MERFGRRPRVKVGTRVGVLFGRDSILEGWVVEDRGDISVQGEQVLTVYYEPAPGFPEWTEIRASELRPPPSPEEVEALRRSFEYWREPAPVRRRSASRKARKAAAT